MGECGSGESCQLLWSRIGQSFWQKQRFKGLELFCQIQKDHGGERVLAAGAVRVGLEEAMSILWAEPRRADIGAGGVAPSRPSVRVEHQTGAQVIAGEGV